MWRKASPVLTVATSSRANIQGWSLIGASNREHPSTCWFARLPLPEIERKRQEPTHAQTWCRKLQSTRTDKYSLSSRPEAINTENERRLQYPHSRGNHVRQRSISSKKKKNHPKTPNARRTIRVAGVWLAGSHAPRQRLLDSPSVGCGPRARRHRIRTGLPRPPPPRASGACALHSGSASG